MKQIVGLVLILCCTQIVAQEVFPACSMETIMV